MGESGVPQTEKLGRDESERTRRGNEIRSAGEDIALGSKRESPCQFKCESKERTSNSVTKTRHRSLTKNKAGGFHSAKANREGLYLIE